MNPVIDLFFEFVFVDEAVDLDGAEKVADAFADRFSIIDDSRSIPKACFEPPNVRSGSVPQLPPTHRE